MNLSILGESKRDLKVSASVLVGAWKIDETNRPTQSIKDFIEVAKFGCCTLP